MTTDGWLYYAVDRIEGEAVILVGDEGDEHVLPRFRLPEAREGTVFRVPLSSDGPVWEAASIDADEEARRRTRAGEILSDLKRHDPGGDLKL